ncbi:MAG TPA: amino acid ABC transporter permease [Candidatus Binatia bacterium]|nr:amino acid ABC transporter permease [Candidatus Binatia bacterium]
MFDLGWLFTWDNIRFLLGGLGMTLAVAGLSIVFSSILGLLLAFARLSPVALIRYPAIFYIEVMRALPILLVIFFTYFALPQIGIRLSPFAAGVTAMSAFTASLVAEIVRAGILSVNRGLVEAASAQGLTRVQTLRLIILPIALRRMMPTLVSQFITLIKDTSLTAVIGILELVRRAQIIYSGPPFQPIPVFALIALIYFVVNYGLSLGSRRLEQAI